jgi:splicing factor 3A subunit 2
MAFISAREHGSKIGTGGAPGKEQVNRDRKERLRKLALESVDLSKDPYFMRNHLGRYECRLCLTLHTNEGNYLAHTQGKKHQQNLRKREAKEQHEKQMRENSVAVRADSLAGKSYASQTSHSSVKIGRPGYRVTKQLDRGSLQRALLFQIEYPQIDASERPHYRLMSPFEQHIEKPDRSIQYLLFAAEPYEVVAFKIPNVELDKADGKFWNHWEPNRKVFSLQLYFKPPVDLNTSGNSSQQQQQPSGPPPAPPAPPSQ